MVPHRIHPCPHNLARLVMNLELLTQVVAVVNTIALVIGGLYLAYNKMSVDRRREVDLLDQETVNNLKTNVDSFKDQIAILQAELVKIRSDYQNAMVELARLKGENAAMTTLLQGKDQLTQDFYTKAIQNMKLTSDHTARFEDFVATQAAHWQRMEAFLDGAIEFRNDIEKLTRERRVAKPKK